MGPDIPSAADMSVLLASFALEFIGNPTSVYGCLNLMAASVHNFGLPVLFPSSGLVRHQRRLFCWRHGALDADSDSSGVHAVGGGFFQRL